jgi:hypothetical protein
MDGIVTKLRVQPEGKELILRFVLERPDGADVAVEMRGEQLRGVLDDGDRVALPDNNRQIAAVDKVARPRELQNLTTESVVYMWRPAPPRRALRYVGSIVGTTAISSVVGSLVTAFIVGGGGDDAPGGGGPVAPPSTSQPEGIDVGEVLTVAVFIFAVMWGIWFLVWGRARHRRGALLWPVSVGLALGALVSSAIFWERG